MRICAFEECKSPFEPKKHNMKYCSDECCRRATNARLMEQYYERKARRSGHVRTCARCDARLSRYNDEKVCQSCKAKDSAEARHALLRMLG